MEGPRDSGPSICQPRYLTATNSAVFSVWDYVPHDTYLCRTRGNNGAVGSKRKASTAWTRVHAIFIITCALKLGLSEMRDGDTWQGEEVVIFIERLASRLIGTVGSSSDGGAPSSGGPSSRSGHTGSGDRDCPLT